MTILWQLAIGITHSNGNTIHMFTSFSSQQSCFLGILLNEQQ